MKKEEKKTMTNLEMLCWGVKHIANNHGFKSNASVKEAKTEGEVCIYGGSNIPTYADIKMLCKDCGFTAEQIADCVEESEYGIDIYFPCDWWEELANKPYKTPFHEFWRRVA